LPEKTLTFLHTSPVLVPAFTALAAKELPGVRVVHMVDESLIKNTIASGSMTPATARRVVRHVESAFEAGADAVMVTCSSIGRAVGYARPLFAGPVLRIDERMAERAVSAGPRIGVLATLNTTLEPTVQLVRETAAAKGKSPDVAAHLCEGAFAAVLRGDTETHDRAVAEGLAALTAQSVDVIVLAQASMARVIDALPAELKRVPILASPPLAMEQAREVLLQKD